MNQLLSLFFRSSIGVLLAVALLSQPSYSQDMSSPTDWQKSLGGTRNDYATSISQTSDGGYIVAGWSRSTDGDVTGHHGSTDSTDCWIVKLTSVGVIEWQKSLGGSGHDVANSMEQTADGGYIIAGYSRSTNGDVTGNHGSADYWIVKLTSGGDVAWQKSLGGGNYDEATSIKQTSDGGYIVAGSSRSTDGDVTGNHGLAAAADYWIVKLTDAGVIEWQKSLGGSGRDSATSIHQTSDGGYIVAGESRSTDGDVTGHHESADSADYWVVKLTNAGEIKWQKSLGGWFSDKATAIQQTSDDGYIVAGESRSINGDVRGHHGSSDAADYWVVKLTSGGGIEWERSLGGSRNDRATSIAQTADGGCIVAGASSSNDGDVRGHYGYAGSDDYWIVKLSSTGVMEWQQSLGSSGGDAATSIKQTHEGGYIVAGSSSYTDGHVMGNHLSVDYWVVKLTPASLNEDKFRDLMLQGLDLERKISPNYPTVFTWSSEKSIPGTKTIELSEDNGLTWKPMPAVTATGDVKTVEYTTPGYPIEQALFRIYSAADKSDMYTMTKPIQIVKSAIEWQKTFGGSHVDQAASIKQTSDGGYIVAGSSNSNNGNVSGHHGAADSADYWIVKLTSARAIQWQRSLGGSGTDKATSIEQTSDGGYIVAGESRSTDGNVTGHHGSAGYSDYWIVKLTSAGAIQWQKSLGGSGSDRATSIQQASDGGYIVAGSSYSTNDDVTGHHGTSKSSDYWIVKLTSAGEIQWQKSLGGTNYDEATSIEHTSDGGYIVAGWSYSTDGDVTTQYGIYDFWIVKLTSAGEIQWQKSLGGSNMERAMSIEQTSDGGYIVAGWSRSTDGDVTGQHGVNDYWVVKLTSTGGIQWQRSLGGSKDDEATSITQASDGGYIVVGSSESFDGDVTVKFMMTDFWIVKLTSAGMMEWQQAFGGNYTDEATSISQASDSGYIVAGSSWSNDGYVTGQRGFGDVWIVKLPPITPKFTSLILEGADSAGKIGTSYPTAFTWSTNKNIPGARTIELSEDNGATWLPVPAATATGDVTTVQYTTPIRSIEQARFRIYSASDKSDMYTMATPIQIGQPPSVNIEWQKLYGGSNLDRAACIQQTSDGGYIVAGSSSSTDGDVTGHHGTTVSPDYWILKLTSTGAIEWQKSLGGSSRDEALSITQTSDGGYIVAGSSYSNDGDVTGNHGLSDCWIVKLTNAGGIEWQQSFGGTQNEYAQCIRQTSDGGYIVAGSEQSTDGDVTGHHGSADTSDCWIVKLTSAGGIEWQRSYGGTMNDGGSSIEQTSDGGYIVAGESYSNDGDVSGHHVPVEAADYWVVKLTSAGIIEWEKSFGGRSDDHPRPIKQTSDGGYIVGGSSWSTDGDISGHHGPSDYWIVKLTSAGDDPVAEDTGWK